LKTWQYINDGKEIKNLNAFFYKIARNLVIDHYRKMSLASSNVSLENERENLEEQIKATSDELEKIETKLAVENIEAKLKELKDEYREIIILRYIENLSIGEIAEIIEKKKGNVRVLLYRALNTLKDLMAKDKKS
jgi:RNA polymerase sigma-70 factor (ECF subfamily)